MFLENWSCPMRKWISLLALCVTTSCLANSALESCFSDTYALDQEQIAHVLALCGSEVDNEQLVSTFVDISFAQNPEDGLVTWVEDDALAVAPETHQLVVENERVRILWSTVQPGE